VGVVGVDLSFEVILLYRLSDVPSLRKPNVVKL